MGEIETNERLRADYPEVWREMTRYQSQREKRFADNWIGLSRDAGPPEGV